MTTGFRLRRLLGEAARSSGLRRAGSLRFADTTRPRRRDVRRLSHLVNSFQGKCAAAARADRTGSLG
jgi:hypothetical protein